MSTLSARKKGVKRTVSIGKVAPETAEQVEDLDGRIEAIQWLIPLGLQAVAEELQRAVVELAGPRYQRKGSDQPLRRWGSQLGSVYLADQKLPVDVPRVRNVANHTEVPLDVYQALQTPRQMDEGLLLRMLLKGIATRNYEACAEAVPEAFGLSSSSVSRRYVKGTARKLAEFQERSLEGYDLVALFLDGKSFADEEIIIALGVTLDGQKIPLGFVQAATENERVCRRFLSDLVERGMQYEAGLLVVIDGAKGLYKAVMSVAQRTCLRAALPVSQAPERRVVSVQERAVRYGSQDGGGLRQTEIRGGQGGTGRAQTGLEVDESVRPTQPRGRHGRDPHTPSVGTDADAQGFLPHHQLHRERQQSPGAAHTQRATLDQLITASPLGSHGTARHRTTSRYCQMLWMARERIPAISGCLFHFTVDEWHPLDDLGDELVAPESAPVFLRIGGQFEYHGESGYT